MVLYSAVDVVQMLSNLDLLGSNGTKIPPWANWPVSWNYAYICMLNDSFIKRKVYFIVCMLFYHL